MSKIKVRLFGAFRNLHSEPEISIELHDTVTVAQFREVLGRALQDQSLRRKNENYKETSAEENKLNFLGLLQKSALANETAVLLETDFVHVGDRIALLPPVSGG